MSKRTNIEFITGETVSIEPLCWDFRVSTSVDINKFVDSIGIEVLLDAIGEEACREHFGIEEDDDDERA